MRKLFIGFFMCVFFAVNASALPLVFKTTKEVKSGGELLTFDTTKYKDLRLGVSIVSGGGSQIQDGVRIEAVDGLDLMYLDNFLIYKDFPSRTISIENPPSKIKLTATVAGTYKVFVWAE